MRRKTFVRYLEIIATLIVFALVGLRSRTRERLRILGNYRKSLVARIKCFLEGRNGISYIVHTNNSRFIYSKIYPIKKDYKWKE